MWVLEVAREQFKLDLALMLDVRSHRTSLYHGIAERRMESKLLSR